MFLLITQITHIVCDECIYWINLEQPKHWINLEQPKHEVGTNNNTATNKLLIELHATIHLHD